MWAAHFSCEVGDRVRVRVRVRMRARGAALGLSTVKILQLACFGAHGVS